MPWWTFTAYNVAGALLWTCTWGLGTYYLGRDIHVIAAFFHRHRPLLLVLGAIAFVALLVYLLRSRRVQRDAKSDLSDLGFQPEEKKSCSRHIIPRSNRQLLKLSIEGSFRRAKKRKGEA